MSDFRARCVVLLLLALFAPAPGFAQSSSLEQELIAEGAASLARAAREQGDPQRGAITFYQPYLACRKCHAVGDGESPLGPHLSRRDEPVSDEFLIESVLQPSREIRKGYESVIVLTVDGKTMTGLLVKDAPLEVTLRDVSRDGQVVTIPRARIEEVVPNRLSIMPSGLSNLLASRQQFLDLARYLIEVNEHGVERAEELRPAPSFYAARPLPEYEQNVDHAGLISDWDDESFERGEAIYLRLCINCHGTRERPGSLPTSLRFASDRFKNGSDPYTMYQTLTRGFGMMVPQTWMVPQQKYDVIHYIREAYLKPYNSEQYVEIDDAYLQRLPQGTTRGPAPRKFEPWITMDYGRSLIASYEIGDDGTNFAYKGIAVRLDAGPGGVSRGRYWMIFDHDTLRVAAGWTGDGFIDWNGILFNGRHAIHPRVVGDVQLANGNGPGWANPEDGSFTDPRLRGRDDKPYGPLPRDWAHYKGLYHYGDQVIVQYSVGQTDVLEMPGLGATEPYPVFARTLNLGPRDREMVLQVASHEESGSLRFEPLADHQNTAAVALIPESEAVAGAANRPVEFDGGTRWEVAPRDAFDMTGADYSIAARFRTDSGGTLFCETAPEPKWVPDGKTLFVRNGRLTFDIGWVGYVASRARVDDGQWREVVMTWTAADHMVRFYIDGRLDQQKTLAPKNPLPERVIRIGDTSDNFPSQSGFEGDLADLRFYQRALSPQDVRALQLVANRKSADSARGQKGNSDRLVAAWSFGETPGGRVPDRSGHEHDALRVSADSRTPSRVLLAGVAGASPDLQGLEWECAGERHLRLHIPAGDRPLRLAVWTSRPESADSIAAVIDAVTPLERVADLSAFLDGGPRRWRETVKTELIPGEDDGEAAFVADVLQRPDANPWLCRVRPTGFDFFEGGDRAALCTWDGDVWFVDGVAQADSELVWQRVASGLFQPLGLKIVEGQVYVTCRDQLVILHDLNGDGETDFYENFNNDHQVTEHFHEFAMGLQRDAEGNFYYAKSARHALPALVPHHGTLLRVTPDGNRTEIVATGFRAANGVCINPDGTFIVTDQEGHWNPKNRINWVHEGGFYGNMWGYHDVTDTSDAAMEQPLCWITNSFDRSPAELLWVDSQRWGPFQGGLLNLSYGYGKVYLVLYEQLEGQMQGGLVELPIPQFPTGVMRGRFHPENGQLYLCGMFAWAGSQQQPGGFYRLRYTGRPAWLPTGLEAHREGVRIHFSEPLDPETAADPSLYAVKTWSLKRTANYGSDHYDEKTLEVADVTVAHDRRSVFLKIPEIQTTWCMEIRYRFTSPSGDRVRGVIHNTIHHLR